MSADETPQPNNAASANNAPHPETYREGKLDVRRVAMITNPKAGKGRSGDKLAKARNRLVELGVDVVHMQGASAEASRELAAEAVADDAIDAIACCGGDGLVSLVLQEQAMSGKPLGIIPTGTGNDHAREYGIPLDPERAAETIAVGRYRTTDLGLMRGPGVDGHWFGTIAMAGFDSLVTERTNRISWPTGKMRYVAAGGGEVPEDLHRRVPQRGGRVHVPRVAHRAAHGRRDGLRGRRSGRSGRHHRRVRAGREQLHHPLTGSGQLR